MRIARIIPSPPASRDRTARRSSGRHLFWIGLGVLFIPALMGAPPGHPRGPLTQQHHAALLDDLVANSPHRLALQAAAALYGPGEETVQQTVNPLAPPPPPPKAWPAKKGRRVYGFLPYWIGSGNVFHWQELTQLAYFAAELKSNGTFGSLHGWGGSSAKKLIALAHKHGVQVPLTITLFSKSGISAVLATASKRTALIKKITDLVISGGGDGVNIDFEGLQKADRDEMKAFIAELDVTMKKKLPGADVTLATPAVDWSGAWDYDYLAEHSDGLFVMAYGLHWKGSNPGPQLPMAKDPPWTHKTLPWVVDDYFQWGKAKNKHKFIIGLPLYGNQWPSASNKVGAKKLANGKAVTMESAWAAAAGKGGWKYDPGSKSAWYTWLSGGTWQQVWVETPNTFAFRTEYLDKRDVQLGLWALGYADKMTKVWKSIADYQAKGKTVDPGPDAGGTDAGGTDAGGTDAGGADAGGAPDAGSKPDAGGSVDAGKPPKDSGSKDTGSQDSGKIDSGGPAGDDANPAADQGAPGADAAVTGPDSGAAGPDVTQPEPDAAAHSGVDSEGRRSPTDIAVDAAAPDVGGPVPVMHAAAPGSGCSAQPDGPRGPPAAFALLLLAVALTWGRRAAAQRR